MNKLMNAKDIIPYLQEGMTLSTVGFSLMGSCGTILKEIERSFLDTGFPHSLTLFHASGQSDRRIGIQHLAHKGLIKKIVGAHWGLAPKWGELINRNEVEAFCFPQGQLVHVFRAMASGKPGVFSKIGLWTFVDPRIEGGKMNERTRSCPDMVRVIDLLGEEYLFYQGLPIDVALIRGTTADEFGNITMEEEASKLEMLSVAQAAKANGGKVFAQVKYLAKNGSLHPKDVVVPGILVDGIVVSENPEQEHRQSSSYFFSPVYSGDVKTPETAHQPLPLTIRKIIGRRAAMELFPGAVVNLGTGIPGDTLGAITAEEEINHLITLTIESGAIGGVPVGGIDFGLTQNADAIIEHGSQFDYYIGCGVDVTFMGMAEADAAGNVNVSKFGSRTMGCGGFIDITQSAKKVVFCTTFNAGALDVGIDRGNLRIRNEGETCKFVKSVEQITFSGLYARSKDQKVVFVTERAVFELSKEEGLTITEIAPGVDLEKDIMSRMEIRPNISKNIKAMDACIFEDAPMGLSKRHSFQPKAKMNNQ